ncbi:MAG: type II toxin-antitoxin system PemK/MazF family toxin [Candidatus Methanoperedens sp.]|nr:type II toxin-antitoxin system PemK/MazF family toxin [Candidatus Methanoperedens sp.]MCZ7361704.1 type II toxin-antitoxin system PemK/MazF family toxin [Candidatus Methanoperedens sp.]HLB71874.1 type II toxin-antitoxin system PemK/MazF family toxin [Candidatus Methanoperedens sp.]
MKGKIVLVPFPFTDLTAAKLRPALVLYEGDKDVIMAFISSKIPSEPSEVDVLITKKHSAFKNAGLKVASVVKLDKIATVLEDLIVGEIGELNQELRKEVNQKIKKILEI